jgi:hypothetical protein
MPRNSELQRDRDRWNGAERRKYYRCATAFAVFFVAASARPLSTPANNDNEQCDQKSDPYPGKPPMVWRAFLAALFARPLTPDQLAIYQQH